MVRESLHGRIDVLVVDDDPDFAEMTATFLDRLAEPLAVETATGAEEGLSRLEAGELDCVVCDYDMPGMSGLEFFDAVRERGFTVPFILFTGKGSEEIASRAISAGVTDYLQKTGSTGQYERLANRILHATSSRRTEQEARDAEAHFQAVVQNAPDVILTIDESSTIRFVNKAVESVFGYQSEEVEGESLTMLMPEQFRDRHETAIRRYIETGERQLDWSGLEFPGLHRNGHEIPLSVSFGTFTRNGERYFTGIIRNVSDRKEDERALENARAFTENALDILDEIFFVCDEDESFLRWNERLTAVTGYPDEAIQSMQLTEFFADDDAARMTNAIQECLETGEARVTADVVTGNGERLPFEFRIHTLTDASGDLIGIAGVGRDIGDRRELEH